MLDSRLVLATLHWNSTCVTFVFEILATDFEQKPLVTDLHIIRSPTLCMNVEQ